MLEFYIVLLLGSTIGTQAQYNSEHFGRYFGKFIGSFQNRHHGVQGDVYAVDSRTLHIAGFSYDGAGPDAFFWAGETAQPSPTGFIVPDEKGTLDVLKPYRNKELTLTLPDGKTLRDIKYISVWCRAYTVNFGDLLIPSNFDFPRPQRLAPLKGEHGVTSGDVVVVDAQTLLVPDFSYDGKAPDVHFWTGKGKAGPEGIRIPDESGLESPLKKYDRKTMVLTLPGDLTIFDVDFLSVWCRLYYVNFASIDIPKNLNVPPSLRMLGIAPQSKLNCEVLLDDLAFEVRWAVAGETIVMQLVGKIDANYYMSFGLSGEETRSRMIGADVAVTWIDAVSGKGYADDYFLDAKAQCSGGTGSCPDQRFRESTNSIRLLNAALVNGFTMVTFQRPLRADDELDTTILTNRTQSVVWAIGPINSRAEVSYHKLTSKGDLFVDFGRAPQWNCPVPVQTTPKPTIAVRQPPPVISTPQTIIQPKQPLRIRGNNNNNQLDFVPPANNFGVQPQEVSNVAQAAEQKPNAKPSGTRRRRPGTRRRRPTTTTVEPSELAIDNQRLQAAATSINVTPLPSHILPPAQRGTAWHIPPIQCHEPEDGVFYAQMGPTGGKSGYQAITGYVGWGIAWYINGLLIPEITVVRGRTYLFVAEGGNNPENPARYHPFYITDDHEGGYQYKNAADRQKVRVFAGVGFDARGEPFPTGTGRHCIWTDTSDASEDSYSSFSQYQRQLQLKCDEGQSGVVQWTPDHNTPDSVYYQCYTHRYLGWKIHVVDQCNQGGVQHHIAAGSETKPVKVSLDSQEIVQGDDDQVAEDSEYDDDGISSDGAEVQSSVNVYQAVKPPSLGHEKHFDTEDKQVAEVTGERNFEEDIKWVDRHPNEQIKHHIEQHVQINDEGKYQEQLYVLPASVEDHQAYHQRPPQNQTIIPENFRNVQQNRPYRQPVKAKVERLSTRPGIFQQKVSIAMGEDDEDIGYHGYHNNRPPRPHYRQPIPHRNFHPKNQLPSGIREPFPISNPNLLLRPGPPYHKDMMRRPPIRIRRPPRPLPPVGLPLPSHQVPVGPPRPTKPPVNFDHLSVVVEKGFKPIARNDEGIILEEDDEPLDVLEADNDVEASIIAEAAALPPADEEQLRVENPFSDMTPISFGPVFRPSPPDYGSFNVSEFGHSQKQKQNGPVPIQLPVSLVPIHPSQVNNVFRLPEFLSEPVGPIQRQNRPVGPPNRNNRRPPYHQPIAEDRVAAASERREPLSLVGSKIPRLPANQPQASLVSYDGSPIEQGMPFRADQQQNRQKPSQNVKNGPQYGPFRGSLPPNVPEYVPVELLPQLNPRRPAASPFRQSVQIERQQVNSAGSSISHVVIDEEPTHNKDATTQISSLATFDSYTRAPYTREPEREEAANLVYKQQEEQDQQEEVHGQKKNTTDFQILADIWSIINQDTSKVSRPSTSKRETVIADRDERQLRKKRTADHVPGHEAGSAEPEPEGEPTHDHGDHSNHTVHSHSNNLHKFENSFLLQLAILLIGTRLIY